MYGNWHNFAERRRISRLQGEAIVLPSVHFLSSSKIFSFVYEPKRTADQVLLLKATRDLHVGFLQKYCCSGPLLKVLNRATGHTYSLTETLLSLNVLSSLKLGVPAEVIYFFIVHCLLLPHLTVRERGHVHQVLPSKLTQIISLKFLPALFGQVAVLLAGSDFQFDMDGTIFFMLIAFCGSQGASANLTHLVGPVIIAQAQVIWSALNGPILDLEAFYARYLIPKDYFSDVTQHRLGRIEPHRLLQFHNPVFDGDMSQICISTPGNDADIDLPFSEFDIGGIFSDTQHWHNTRTILPAHLGGSKPTSTDERSKRRMLRSDQHFMAVFHVQAASLTGASGGVLEQVVILPLGSRRASILAPEVKVSMNFAYFESRQNYVYLPVGLIYFYIETDISCQEGQRAETLFKRQAVTENKGRKGSFSGKRITGIVEVSTLETIKTISLWPSYFTERFAS